MSVRNDIADDLVAVLKDIRTPRPVLVTREPFEVEKLAITQFPAILVQTGTESRETKSMGDAGFRRGNITFTLRCYVRGTELDYKRNEFIEAIEEKIDADRYRLKGSTIVQGSQISAIEVIDRLPPLAEFTITYDVEYFFVRGTA